MSIDELRATAFAVASADGYDKMPIVEIAVVLAHAYLADHPADEDEPVTEDWLRSIGLKLRMGFGFPVTKTMSLWDSRNGWGLYFHGGLGDSAEGETKIAKVATRGQVRRLLAALGIDCVNDHSCTKAN
jgi:hypothetical protein